MVMIRQNMPHRRVNRRQRVPVERQRFRASPEIGPALRARMTFPIPRAAPPSIYPQYVGLAATGGTTIIGMVPANLAIQPRVDIVVTSISMNAGTW